MVYPYVYLAPFCLEMTPKSSEMYNSDDKIYHHYPPTPLHTQMGKGPSLNGNSYHNSGHTFEEMEKM